MQRNPNNGGAARAALALNVGGAIVFALVVNAFVFALGWNRSNAQLVRPPFSPPDAVVGVVWVVLFAAMGYARFLIVTSGAPNASRDARLVVGLIVFCALYPLYTLGLSNLSVATAGNVATGIAALGVAWFVRRGAGRAAALLVPVALWVSFATYLTVGTMLRNHGAA
jgi:tryptophan-rich sensory protein